MQIPQIFLTLLLISVCTFFTAKLKNDRLKRSENKYRDFTQQADAYEALVSEKMRAVNRLSFFRKMHA